MKKIGIILKEQIQNFAMIVRIAIYENKSSYQGHYLGIAWEFLNPAIQLGTFYIVFGRMRASRYVDGIPFAVWMLIGMACWFYMNKGILDSSMSIHRNIRMVSKMKFPMSVLPLITMIGQLRIFFVMIGIALFSVFTAGVVPTIYWLQAIYYFFAMIVFMYFVGLFSATMTILIRDYHFVLQALMRALFFFSGATIVIEEVHSGPLGRLLQLSPIFYILHGFRDAFLSRAFFWERGVETLFFWTFTLLIAVITTHLHLKFRAKFVDLL